MKQQHARPLRRHQGSGPAGHVPYSRREAQVVALTMRGLSLKEMRAALGDVSISSISSYRRRAMQKCGARTVTGLVLLHAGRVDAPGGRTS